MLTGFYMGRLAGQKYQINNFVNKKLQDCEILQFFYLLLKLLPAGNHGTLKMIYNEFFVFVRLVSFF